MCFMLPDEMLAEPCLGEEGVAEVGHELCGGQAAHLLVAEGLEGLLQGLVEQRAAAEALRHIL